MRPQGSTKELECRRRRAVELLKQGYGPVDVARQLGVARRSVRRWKAAYGKGGMGALEGRKSPGRPPRLTLRQKGQLEEALLEGAQAHGFSTDLWTCPRVAQLIRRRFRVDYHVDHVCRLLHALGWSPQKPQRRAVERDEKAIQNWIKQDWPRIKKKPPG